MANFHRTLRTPPSFLLLLLFILLVSCGESPDEKISKGHRDAIKSQCKGKSDTKLCSREVRKSFIDNGHEYVTFFDLEKDQIREIKLNCHPDKKYGLVKYNDCLYKWKELAKGNKLTDPDDEREKTVKSNIDKLKEYTYYILGGTETDPFGAGTGVAVGEHYIATNCHVIYNYDEKRFTKTIMVWNLLDPENKKGRVKLYKEGLSIDLDICILKTKSKLKYVKKKIKFSKLEQTDFVRALGNPIGIMGHTADGNINALQVYDRSHLGENYITPNKYIVHDAAIGSGSSGGPLFDIAGNLVGINTWVYQSIQASGDEGGRYISGGFGNALSADHINDVLND